MIIPCIQQLSQVSISFRAYTFLVEFNHTVHRILVFFLCNTDLKLPNRVIHFHCDQFICKGKTGRYLDRELKFSFSVSGSLMGVYLLSDLLVKAVLLTSLLTAAVSFLSLKYGLA